MALASQSEQQPTAFPRSRMLSVNLSAALHCNLTYGRRAPGARVRVAWWLIANAMWVTACAPAVPVRQPAPLPPISPFDETPIVFSVSGQRFARGEHVVVTVCLAPDRSIASAQVLESSGDSKFDALAVTWARRVRLRAAARGELLATCGAVHVEVHPSQEPPVLRAPVDTLG